jgi:hypothetical protein
MQDTLKSKLVGEQLSSVEFVQDYVQLHFDGRTLTAYIWPEIKIKDSIFRFGEIEYRNKLCNLIGVEVEDLFLKDKEFLIILFNDEKGVISINLSPTNPEIISEIAIFNDELDQTWAIFD